MARSTTTGILVVMYYIHDFKAKIDMVFMQVTPQLLDEM
jgi:hypothetical protein